MSKKVFKIQTLVMYVHVLLDMKVMPQRLVQDVLILTNVLIPLQHVAKIFNALIYQVLMNVPVPKVTLMLMVHVKM